MLDSYTSAEAPLAGKLWDTSTQEFVSLEQVLTGLPNGSWLLLGETHENLDHHRLQAEIFDYLAANSRLGNVGLEMAHTDQQPLLDQALNQEIDISAESLAWQKGWPWEWYVAPVSSALTSAKRVIAGDLTREDKMQAYRDESLKVPASEAYRDFMLTLLYDAHCGQMPKSQLGSMLRVQYARDLSMLKAMQANTDASTINVFLAGTVHARDDLGIPYWEPELESTTVLMIAADTSTTPEDYYPDSYTSAPTADYLLFTPGYTYESGCN